MRVVRQQSLPTPDRALQAIDEPLLAVELNELMSLSFDFNFGDGQKDLLFGVRFHYDSGDSLSDSVKDLLETFMSETLGDPSLDLGSSDFSFADTAADLANDLIESLVIDVAVGLDFAFGLDLNPMFNSSAVALSDRIPNPFIKINQFDIAGAIGVNEWTTNILFGDIEFAVASAQALVEVSASLSSTPIDITSPSELIELVNPQATGDRIVFSATFDVRFPVFLVHEGVGFGASIEYK